MPTFRDAQDSAEGVVVLDEHSNDVASILDT